MRSLLALLPATLLLALVPAAGRAETIGSPAVNGFWGGDVAQLIGRVPPITLGANIETATVGYSFTTNHTLTVVSLGALSRALPTNVRLYDGAGDLLASAAVSLSDQALDVDVHAWGLGFPVVANERFSFHPLAIPVTLDVNRTYYVVADVLGWDVPFGQMSVSSDPAISLMLQPPPGADAFGFGPNFGIQTPVPEPGSAILLLAAAGCLLLYKLRHHATA